MTPIKRAMLLSAGLGQRMRPLTETRPKPLIPVSGRALLDHALDRLAEAGVETVVINTYYLGDQIARHVAGRKTPRIVLSPETALLETGGGVVQALPQLGEAPFFVVNADSLWLDGAAPALHRLQAAWRDDAMDALLMLHRTTSAIGYEGSGDFFVDQLGKLTWRRSGEVAPHAYAGVHVLHPRLLRGARVEKFSLTRPWRQAESEGRLYGWVHDGLWFHVGTPGDLAEAQRYLDELRLLVPERTD